ncbi:hypothetical protein R6Q59_019986 [Mikania micrantha]|uniref:Legume lectin domain-containing protein n=1 Tax=Mikania micrantha TaxID=192012 RepID=A0A5N6PQG1_9ASTR|nr:hypothetical protein E3N88_07044 [Mikania micrantha]
MASSTTTGLLLLSIVIGVFAISAAARPCKTIFFITSSSHHPAGDLFLPKPHFQLIRNPNNSPRLTFFVTEFREFQRTGSLPRPILIDRSVVLSSSSDVVSSEPYYSASTVKTSIRERTMDVVSIAGAVLFGVGCGALTAATMYLFWSLFAPRQFEFESDSESGDEEDDVSPNNNVYFAVSAASKEVPPTADEVDQAAAMK